MSFLVLCLLAAHFLGDWILQPTWMVQRRGHAGILLVHVGVVTACLAVALLAYNGFYQNHLYWLLCVNASAHLATDWLSWYGQRRYPNQAHIRTLEQFLHLAVLSTLFV